MRKKKFDLILMIVLIHKKLSNLKKFEKIEQHFFLQNN